MKLNEEHQKRLVTQIKDLKTISDKKMEDLREWNQYLSFMSASLFNSYEQSQDILWISYIELENEYLKRISREICLEEYIKDMKSLVKQLNHGVNCEKALELCDKMATSKIFESVPKDASFTTQISSQILEIMNDSKFIKGLLMTIIGSFHDDHFNKIGKRLLFTV